MASNCFKPGPQGYITKPIEIIGTVQLPLGHRQPVLSGSCPGIETFIRRAAGTWDITGSSGFPTSTHWEAQINLHCANTAFYTTTGSHQLQIDPISFNGGQPWSTRARLIGTGSMGTGDVGHAGVTGSIRFTLKNSTCPV
jgi:hypothetical protein